MAAEPQRSWRLEIAGYLFLGGTGAGWTIAAFVLGWMGHGLPPRAGAAPLGIHVVAFSTFGGPALTALGALLLVFHLGRNRRLAYTAGRNPRTSWLARGFWVLSGFIAAGSVQLAAAALAPTWADGRPAGWRALEVVVVSLAAGTAIYTGLLLRSMASIPAWRPWPLTGVFVASALSGGTAALVLATGAAVPLGITGEESVDLRAAAGGLDAVFLAAEAVLLVAYVVTLRRGGPAEAGAARPLLAGRLWPAFWILVVGAGLVTPLAVRFVAPVEGWVEAAGVAFAVLAGGFTLRLAVLWAGAKEGPPLRRLSEWRAAARGSGALVLPGAAGAPAEPVVIRAEA